MGNIFTKYSNSKGNAIFKMFITGNLKDMINISSKTGSVIHQFLIFVIYREFSPYANFITANFITAVFQNYY